MGLFNKKADPISSQAKALEKQIAELELEIRQLNREASKPAPPPAPPAPVRPAYANSPQHFQAVPAQPAAPRVPVREPIFESVEAAPPRAPGLDDRGHFNELGVRKYDLPEAWRRLINRFRGQTTRNPKLVTYLATGSIRGLQPLRYEKRIARNNFLLMSLVFLLVLSWLILVFLKHR
jgi:hypothetical protein